MTVVGHTDGINFFSVRINTSIRDIGGNSYDKVCFFSQGRIERGLEAIEIHIYYRIHVLAHQGYYIAGSNAGDILAGIGAGISNTGELNWVVIIAGTDGIITTGNESE